MKNIEARIDLTLIWLLAFAILIIPLKVYQYQEGQIREAVEKRDSLIAAVLNCVEGQTARLTLNDDTDWIDFDCIEVDSNRFAVAYREYHKRVEAARCRHAGFVVAR